MGKQVRYSICDFILFFVIGKFFSYLITFDSLKSFLITVLILIACVAIVNSIIRKVLTIFIGADFDSIFIDVIVRALGVGLGCFLLTRVGGFCTMTIGPVGCIWLAFIEGVMVYFVGSINLSKKKENALNTTQMKSTRKLNKIQNPNLGRSSIQKPNLENSFDGNSIRQDIDMFEEHDNFSNTTEAFVDDNDLFEDENDLF